MNELILKIIEQNIDHKLSLYFVTKHDNGIYETMKSNDELIKHITDRLKIDNIKFKTQYDTIHTKSYHDLHCQTINTKSSTFFKKKIFGQMIDDILIVKTIIDKIDENNFPNLFKYDHDVTKKQTHLILPYTNIIISDNICIEMKSKYSNELILELNYVKKLFDNYFSEK